MKKLGIKKIAAIAAGAVLVGTALAPFASAAVEDIARSDLYNPSTGSVSVNVVAGVNGAVSDWQWSGNLAGALARNASSTGTVSVSSTGGAGDATATVSDLSVDLLVGGVVTVTGGKQYKSDLNSVTTTTYEDWDGSANDTGHIWASDAQLPHLKNESLSYKYNNASFTTTQKEYIGVQPNAQMDTTRVAIEDLVLYMSNEGDFNYTTTFSTGFPAVEDTDDGVTNVKYTDDTNDNVVVYWFGEKYLVNEVDLGNATAVFVKLIKDKAKTTYTVGESFTVDGIGTYDGQTMTVTLTRVVQTSGTATYQATMQLTDQEGNIVDTLTVSTSSYVNFTDTDGSDAVSANTVYISTVAGTIGTNEGYIETLVGTATVDLYEAKGYPYDSSDTDGVYDYKVFMKYDTSDSNRVEELAVANSAVLFDDNNPIYPTQGALTSAGQASDAQTEVDFLNSYATVRFNGFETDESLTTVTIGNSQITFKDSGDASHTIPFFIELQASTSGSSFTFDGQTIWYKVTDPAANNDVNLIVDLNGGAAYLNGVLRVDGNLVFQVADTANFNNEFRVFESDGIGGDANESADGTDISDWNTNIDLTGVNFDVGEVGAMDGNITLVADGNVTFRKTNSTGDLIIGVSGNTPLNNSYYYNDSNTAGPAGEAFPLLSEPLALPGANSRYFYYNLYVDKTTYNKVYLLLDGQQRLGNSSNTTLVGNDMVQYNKNIEFQGTIFDGGTEGDDVNQIYYLPDQVEFGLATSDNSYATAVFSFDEEEGDDSSARDMDLNVYIDTATGKPVVLPNANLTYPTVDLNYGAGGVLTTFNQTAFTLRNDTPASYTNVAYTDFGTKLTVASDKYTFVAPENIPQVVVTLLGTGSSTTLEDSEALTLSEGETGSISTGTQIQVPEGGFSYTATVSGATGDVVCEATPSTYTTMAPKNNRGRVFSDVAAPSTQNIIVGGWAVNTLAPAELQELLQAEGDYAVIKTASGDVAVAGYTAGDTGTAARALIAHIEAGFS